jgi:hypothetical protein
MGIIVMMMRRRVKVEWTLQTLDLGENIFIDIIMHPEGEA